MRKIGKKYYLNNPIFLQNPLDKVKAKAYNGVRLKCRWEESVEKPGVYKESET